ncbi:MAG TPA: hypothetical protein PLD48_04930 [Bacillota bacterium]|nr:hypothetical protein [Bacillota bacterium]HOK68172.1 hypothetical protein [Bacillota bacterium]HPP84970.1 hypothetical protein [Bacillota bacterium]
MRRIITLFVLTAVFLAACAQNQDTLSSDSAYSSASSLETSEQIDANAIVREIYDKIMVLKDIF